MARRGPKPVDHAEPEGNREDGNADRRRSKGTDGGKLRMLVLHSACEPRCYG